MRIGRGNKPAVELQQCLEVDLCLHVVCVLCGGILLLGFIERVDVCLVVLGVVELLVERQ